MAKIEKIISICARAIHEWSPIFWVIFDPPPISDFPPKLKRNVQYLILILETFRFYPFRYDFALGIIWFQKKCLTFFFHHPWLWVYGQKNELYLYWWSKCAFSILLSFALLFWNQILICVSVKSNASASSNLLGLEIYSFLWYSSSSLKVWSDVKVVLCLRCLGSLRLRLATVMKTEEKNIRFVLFLKH